MKACVVWSIGASALAASETVVAFSWGWSRPSSSLADRASTQRARRQPTQTRIGSAILDADVLVKDPMFIEPLTAATMKEGKRSPDELIRIAQIFLKTSNGLGGDPAMLSDRFQFEGPVVGPLSKEAFVKAIGSVDFAAAFPNWTPQFYGFHVDPMEPEQNRAWYTARGEGLNEGPLLPFAPTPTRKKVVNPPQVCSLTIDHETGLITRYTIGYVTDRSVGNTGKCIRNLSISHLMAIQRLTFV